MLVRSEYSFGTAFGSVRAVAEQLPFGGILADTTCFGHVEFAKAMKALGRKAVLGWRCRVHKDPEGKRDWREVAIIPRSSAGLREMYAAVRLAGAQFRYTPRLLARDIDGQDWEVLALPGWAGSPPEIVQARRSPLTLAQNFYPTPGDREAWLIACPRAFAGSAPGHVLSPDEWEANGWARPREEWLARYDTPLPRAENIRFGVPDPDAELRAICEAELNRRGLSAAYRTRLATELDLIAQKAFADYFLVISDMIKWAKLRMLVGPARGSSSGSLVCWLTRITEIDPLKHGLIFERFVDANRADLPDIDIDFADASRHLVVEYLADRYGQENVAHIGTVLRWKPKSALTDVAKVFRIPDADLKSFKDVLIERSSGDSRVNDCLADSFETMDVGKALAAKHPSIRLAQKLEGAAKTSGTHAAGLIVCNAPVNEYCAVGRNGIAQIDKKSAEALNMLKIDALGLRTLSVIDTACAEAGIDRETLYTMPLDDDAAFRILNDQRYSGIFQFEGLALQSLAAQIEFKTFEDLAAIGALARPGPLASGETQKWIARHAGKEPPTPPHPALETLTHETYGVIMYQEQVMRISRELAGFSWKETADIRKLMSNRQGDEAFQKWTPRFVDGCVANGVERGEAVKIWKAINTFGSWAFNKCIDGSVKIRMADVGGSVPLWLSIEELYERYRANPSPWIKQRKGKLPRVWALNEKIGRAFPAAPTDVVFNGRKRCIELRFENDTKIICTADHRFLINGDWTRAGDAKIGDSFSNVEQEPTPYITTVGKGHVKGKRYGKTNKGFPRGAHNPSWANGRSAIGKAYRAKHRDKGCDDCGAKHRRMEVHHLDRSGGKKDPRDLLWLCPGCHKRRHYALGRTRKNERGLLAGSLRLTAVRERGERNTYDLVMPGPHHNFIVDGGIATHNSHSVAYGIVSYWCCWLKAHYPLEFALGCLRHERDQESSVKMLREITKEGMTFVPFDRERSMEEWTVQDGQLIGGLLGVKGVGPITAREIVNRRVNGLKLKPSHERLLTQGRSVFADLFPTRSKFADMYARNEWKGKRWPTPVVEIADLQEESDPVIILGRMMKKNLRSVNEDISIARRGGRKLDGQDKWLLFTLEDDTERISCMVDRWKFEEIGAQILEKGVVGQWFAVRGRLHRGFRALDVLDVRWME